MRITGHSRGEATQGETDDSPSDPPPFTRLNPVAVWLLALTIALAAGVAVLRILTHHPFNDECLHIRMLHLLSSGLTPHEDYWNIYPAPAYLVTLPVFGALPKTASSFLVLRFLMLALVVPAGVLLATHGRRIAGNAVWGVAPLLLLMLIPPIGRFIAEYSIDHFAMLPAVGALTLFFTPPRAKRLGAAAGLCLLSVLFTPKYSLLLLAGLIGMVYGSIRGDRKVLPALAAVGIGGLAAAAVGFLLYALGGVSPVADFRYTHLLMATFNAQHGAGLYEVSVGSAAAGLLGRSIPLLVLCLAGVAGWVAGTAKRRAPETWAPLGLLLGTAVWALLFRSYMLQYTFPTLLVLGMFAPFAAGLLPRAPRNRTPVALAVTLAVLVTAGLALRAVPAELEDTPQNLRDERGVFAESIGLKRGRPAVERVMQIQWLLDRIPADERVLAAPQHHPLLRRDVTFVTADGYPSFKDILDPGDPAQPFFEPSHLRQQLEARPPAYICLIRLEDVSPPGWMPVVERFLRWNASRYTDLTGDKHTFLRTDLFEGAR